MISTNVYPARGLLKANFLDELSQRFHVFLFQQVEFHYEEVKVPKNDKFFWCCNQLCNVDCEIFLLQLCKVNCETLECCKKVCWVHDGLTDESIFCLTTKCFAINGWKFSYVWISHLTKFPDFKYHSLIRLSKSYWAIANGSFDNFARNKLLDSLITEKWKTTKANYRKSLLIKVLSKNFVIVLQSFFNS